MVVPAWAPLESQNTASPSSPNTPSRLRKQGDCNLPALGGAGVRAPGLLAGALILFVAIEIGFYGLSAVLAESPLLGALAWYQIGLANLVAALAMGTYLWRRNPALGGRLDFALGGGERVGRQRVVARDGGDELGVLVEESVAEQLDDFVGAVADDELVGLQTVGGGEFLAKDEASAVRIQLGLRQRAGGGGDGEGQLARMHHVLLGLRRR